MTQTAFPMRVFNIGAACAPRGLPERNPARTTKLTLIRTPEIGILQGCEAYKKALRPPQFTSTVSSVSAREFRCIDHDLMAAIERNRSPSPCPPLPPSGNPSKAFERNFAARRYRPMFRNPFAARRSAGIFSLKARIGIAAWQFLLTQPRSLLVHAENPPPKSGGDRQGRRLARGLFSSHSTWSEAGQ